MVVPSDLKALRLWNIGKIVPVFETNSENNESFRDDKSERGHDDFIQIPHSSVQTPDLIQLCG